MNKKIAIYRGYTNIAVALINADADVNQHNNNGDPALGLGKSQSFLIHFLIILYIYIYNLNNSYLSKACLFVNNHIAIALVIMPAQMLITKIHCTLVRLEKTFHIYEFKHDFILSLASTPRVRHIWRQ